MNETEIAKLQQDVKQLEDEINILRSALLQTTSMTVSVLTVAMSDPDERVSGLEEVRKNLRTISKYATLSRPIGMLPEIEWDLEDE